LVQLKFPFKFNKDIILTQEDKELFDLQQEREQREKEQQNPNLEPALAN
jgi:hypothetical protein